MQAIREDYPRRAMARGNFHPAYEAVANALADLPREEGEDE